MTALPKIDSPTVEAIYCAYKKKNEEAALRGHLGASYIGTECSRALWYQFRLCGKENFTGRILRLFETGHREEPRVVENLRAIGVMVYDVDHRSGKQYRYLLHGGHFGGSLDGIVLGLAEAPKTWHLLEIKTHNAKSFKNIKTKGVKGAKPQHWVQMQMYMGMAKLTRALYFAVNKDTDDLYTERVRFEPVAYNAHIDKARRIIKSPEPLTKISDSDESFGCRWCSFKAICHGNKVPPTHCRTCVHSEALTEEDGGQWWCARHGKSLTRDEQLGGCDNHLYEPHLISYAEPTERGDDWIAYRIRSRDQAFVNCGAKGSPTSDAPRYASTEIASVHPDIIGHPAVEDARKIVDGKIVAK